MIATILLLFAALIFSLQFKPVQTYVAKKAAKYMSRELNTRVEVQSLYIKPFKSLVLEGLLVEDREKDTLLFTPRILVDINTLSIKNRRIVVNTAQLDKGTFYVKQYKDSTSNLQFLFDYFHPEVKKPKKKPAKPYHITFSKIVLNNVGFRYKNFNYNKTIKGVNFNDFQLRNLSTVVRNLDTKNHLAKAEIRNLTFREKSGFYLKTLNTSATIDTNRMEFANLLLVTPDSRISDYLLMKFSTFKDLQKFINKVHLTARFKDSKIYFKDIAYFAPGMRDIDFRLSISGTANGYVDNFQTKNIRAKAGQTTYLVGNFKVKGLPSIGRTRFDLEFDRLYSNRRDVNFILGRLTRSNKEFIPPMVDKLGNVNFRGSFTGLTNDFRTRGEFKTRLGRVVADINMRLPAGKTPTYSGNVQGYDFNVQDLLNNPALGRSTFNLAVNGSSFNVEQLSERIKGNITYFDFKNYRYTNIRVNGSFHKKLFDGQLTINDRNVNLTFNGNVNLNPKLPVFNFSSNIRGANLHVLNLVKDTLQIDADLTTNFSGNDIDNIQGDFQIREARLTNSASSFTIDSVSLVAAGLGNNRSLSIRSDILNASIEGKYHLKTLPDYFKTLIKNYVPSIDFKLSPFQAQNFVFRLNLKDFEPISQLFIPKLKVPEPAVFNGRFASADSIATFNAFAPLITYNNIKINNLIIDETTSKKAMNIFVTSDRVDLTDSLYVQNINIANILSKDSLNLNIKLSDKSAANQLDLNGLAVFNKETFANLSLLPSEVLINNETWKVQEQVQFGFDQGKMRVDSFQLSREGQSVTINGTISNNPQDHLIVGFDNFRLTTFNPITDPLGINLGGLLDGEINVAAIGKAPHFDGKLQVDTLRYNNVIIGDLDLEAGFDNATKLVDVDINIKKDGTETLDITGTYNANIEQQTLDLAVKMDENEVILFQPLLKNLVSDMTGKVSADLTVSGKARNPRIDGTISLNDAGLTVNYLKTHYRITDDFQVDNTVIRLQDVVLRDVRNNQAIANGTVNMENPNVPIINVNVKANNFQALNTTAKDNPLYYGVAYGTGTFRFNGPTNNMKINIRASTEEGTVFNIPLNAAETVGESQFITFVAKDSSLTVPKQAAFKGLTMNFDLQVDEQSEVNIITDLGRLTGRGNATLSMDITSFGDFQMFGEYQISQGRFNFTAQEFINKIFEIRQGGQIRWTGNPTEADINLKAVYGVRTSLEPLFTAANRTAPEQQRVLAEAVMNLNGLILHPDISFDINFPQDASIRDQVQSYLSDVNNLNQQALSLIVRRSFAAGGGNMNLREQTTSTIISAGTELAFNQLNNILAQYLGLKYVDLNIRSLNEASASVRLFDDRLILTGGVTDTRGNVGEFEILGGRVARDVEALYLLRRDGSLTLRASNRLNNRSILNLTTTNQDEYVSALGLIYRQEFDNLDEFLRLLIGRKRSEERLPAPRPNEPAPGIVEPRKPAQPVTRNSNQ